MKKHKIYLEDVMEEIKNMGEYYPMTYTDGDAFELKPDEMKGFTEELLNRLKQYLESEMPVDAEEDEDDDDDIDMFLFDGDDDLN